MKKLLTLFLFTATLTYGQGLNHQWLLGSFNYFNDPKGRMLFDINNYTLVNENRKMVFKGTEANLSDSNGNLLMSSNGIWVANAAGDTMMNGSGLNPGSYANSWPNGMVLTGNNVFLTFPDSANLYSLFHHSFYFDGVSYVAHEIFETRIDITLDGGLGSVISKNNIVVSDTINQGIAACRHANGRDWWVVCQKQNSDILVNLLATPTGIDTTIYQSIGVPSASYNVTQLTFSQDGKQIAYYLYNTSTLNESVIICDFDRCLGEFSNPKVIPVTLNSYLWGLAFSSSGKYIYTCSSNNVFQIDTDNLTVDTVATYDGFISPGQFVCCATKFYNMYLAANGKIYVTSGSGVQHLHEINYPDSAGLACDVQQHSIFLGYAQLRAVPNHPNYYLGCDTTSGCPCLTTGLEEAINHDFKFSVAPNPNYGNFNIIYLLPQNEKGKLEIYDVNGRQVYEMNLPQWSTMQEVNLPEFVSSGLYNCVITSGGVRVGRKIAIIK